MTSSILRNNGNGFYNSNNLSENKDPNTGRRLSATDNMEKALIVRTKMLKIS